jgi:hypothetical protein
MKASITFRASRYGHEHKIEVDYDSTNPLTMWVEICAPKGVSLNDPASVNTRLYQLKVGEKGGLTLQ